MFHLSLGLIGGLFGMIAAAMAEPVPHAQVCDGAPVAGIVLNTPTCPPGYRPCGSGCCPT